MSLPILPRMLVQLNDTDRIGIVLDVLPDARDREIARVQTTNGSKWIGRIYVTDITPVLSDPATQGVMLQAIRDFWGDAHMTLHYHKPIVDTGVSRDIGDGHAPGVGWTFLNGDHEIIKIIQWHETVEQALTSAWSTRNYER